MLGPSKLRPADKAQTQLRRGGYYIHWKKSWRIVHFARKRVEGLSPRLIDAGFLHPFTDSPRAVWSAAVETLTCANCGVPAPSLDAQCTSCGQPVSSPSLGLGKTAAATKQHSLTGQTLSHYEVQERLGAGGMGVVYRAVDSKLGRAVALKVLAPHLADDEKAKARFIREARSASALDHPNIGTIHEIGEDGPILFIAMALYEGETLKQRLERGPLPVLEAIGLLRQMAAGLAAAHAAGIVHRDIKPANVMLTKNGVKLLDFGLAKLVVDRQAITVDGEAVGTLLYTAPEQLRGERVDHRVDLWSLGAVAYEMLSGASPFRGDSPASTTMKILSSEPAPLISVPGISSELSGAVSRLLNKNPANRIESAEEVLAALDGGPTTIITRTPPVARRWALFISALVAVAGIAAVLWPWIQAALQKTSAPAVGHRPVVAVLGFKNESGQSALGWLSTAIAELLSLELAAGENLVVLDGDSVAHVKADLSLQDDEILTGETLKRIRSLSGAQYVISGSYSEKVNGVGIVLHARLQREASRSAVLDLDQAGTNSKLGELVARLAKDLRHSLGAPTPSAEDLRAARASLPSDPEALRLYAEGISALRNYNPNEVSLYPTRRFTVPAMVASDLLKKAARISRGNILIEGALAEADRQLENSLSRGPYYRLSLGSIRHSATLPREQRLRQEALFSPALYARDSRDQANRTLFELFPENLQYGLALATMQTDGEAVRGVVAELRKLPPPTSDNPSIDLVEAGVERSLRAAADWATRAASKANALGAHLTVADAKACEGYLALLAGDLDRAEAALRISESVYLHLGRGAVLDVLHHIYFLRWLGGATSAEVDKVLELTDRVANDLGNRGWQNWFLRYRIDQALWSGDFANAHVLVEKAELSAQVFAMHARWPLSGSVQLESDLQRVTDQACKSWRSHAAPLLLNNGGAQLAQGAIGSAEQTFEEALRISEASGAQPDLANARLGLAAVAIEEGRSADAEQLAHAGLDTLRKLGIAGYQPGAHSLLGRALLAQGKHKEARDEIVRAGELARGLSNYREELEAAILGARLRAVSKKKNDMEKALADLKKITADAVRLELKYQEFRARQATAEIEIAAGLRQGQADLAALKKDAGEAGFGLFTRAQD
jgi:TolB-like protein